jgi:hypothetical protein
MRGTAKRARSSKNWPICAIKTQLLDDFWDRLFRSAILSAALAEKMVAAFHEVFGRPTKEMYNTLGGLIFQQMFDTIDEEMVRQLDFSLEWQFNVN